MVDAIISELDITALTDGMLAQVKTALFSEPEMTAFEKQFPGTITQIIEALRPMMLRMSDRNVGAARSEMLQLMRENLTPEEAAGASEFYASPTGKRMIQLISENFSMKASLKEAIHTDGEVSIESVRQDTTQTVQKSMDVLTQEELAEIGKLAGKPWLKKLQAIQPQMLELNTRNLNAELSPEEEAEMDRIITAVIAKRTAAKD